MTRNRFLAAALLFSMACAAMAADGIAGKWTMSQQASNGGPPRITTFDLKVDGSALTGTVTAPMGGRAGGAAPTPIAITNGKVNGNAVSFEVVRTFAANSVVTKYQGTLSGDTLRIKQTIDLGNGPLTVQADAKRAAQ